MTDWLSDTFVATSALLLLVLLIRGPVARHFGAGTAYFLWALPAARLFMPTLTQQVALPALPAETGITESVREATLAAIAGGGNADAATPAQSIDWGMAALALWLGGAALLFIVQMFRYAAMREELLSDAAEIDRIGGIRIIQTDRVGGPLAFGLISRYVAVPRDFTHTFSPRERELALAHELAHHRGGDLFANMAAFLFLCLMWFNPLAWMAWSAFRFDQEAACDARVIHGADAHTRQTYGRALARTATEGLPAFAMALNSPSKIIQRLRRLMMHETSKGRRMTGKLAILATAAIALPLTATVVPVYADDEDSTNGQNTEKNVGVKKHKMVIVKSEDGKPVKVDVWGDAETPFVKTIRKDGKTIVLRSKKELSEAEVEKMVAEAEKSRAEAEASLGEAEMARSEAEAARGEAEEARAEAEAHRARALAAVGNMNFAAYIPEINIREIRGKCDEGQPVSTDVRGFDGHNKSSVRIVMCGKGQANIARREAINGLKEARDDILGESDMPESIRKDVIKKLEKSIKDLERQIKAEPGSRDDA
jgi:beta-lactamase regulating signal transducer with metallopeptidase domain